MSMSTLCGGKEQQQMKHIYSDVITWRERRVKTILNPETMA